MSQCAHCQRPLAAKDERCPYCGAVVGVPRAADKGALESSVLALMRQGEKIQAIKLYREQAGVGLAEAKAAVEAIERGDPVPARSTLGGNIGPQIPELLAAGRKIEAIKLYRAQTGAGLAEAKAAVESTERGDTVPASPSLDGNLERQILEMMATGRKIEAIKLYRAQTKAGLKESKEAVEELAASRGIAPTKTGCLGALAVLVACMTAVVGCVYLSMA